MENLFTTQGINKKYNKAGVYLIQIGNKLYVGSSSCSVGSRLITHRLRLRKNSHENIIMINSFNKYGEVNTHFKLLEFCTPEESVIREKFYIDTLKPELNIELDPVLQNSEYKCKKVYQYTLKGDFLSEYRSAADAERALDKSNSKISQCCMNKRKSAYGYLWSYTKVQTLEYTNNSSKAKSKKVAQYSSKDLIRVYNSAAEAVRYIGLSGNFESNCTQISACCLGKIKKAFGYTWKFYIM